MLYSVASRDFSFFESCSLLSLSLPNKHYLYFSDEILGYQQKNMIDETKKIYFRKKNAFLYFFISPPNHYHFLKLSYVHLNRVIYLYISR